MLYPPRCDESLISHLGEPSKIPVDTHMTETPEISVRMADGSSNGRDEVNLTDRTKRRGGERKHNSTRPGKRELT